MNDGAFMEYFSDFGDVDVVFDANAGVNARPDADVVEFCCAGSFLFDNGMVPMV